MMDAFKILAVPRRPWYDPSKLDDIYHELSAERHPDTGHPKASDEEFANLNLAWRTLCEPPLRLKHLLELEFPEQPLGTDLKEDLPEALVELFMDIGSFKARLKTYTAKVRAATTEMAQALLVPEGMGIVEDAKKLLERVYDAAVHLDRENQELDWAWVTEGERDSAALASLQQRWALVAKWRNKLREDLLALEAELGQ